MIDKEAQFFIMLQTYLNIAPNKTNKNWICNHNMCSSERYSFSFYFWTGFDGFPSSIPIFHLKFQDTRNTIGAD